MLRKQSSVWFRYSLRAAWCLAFLLLLASLAACQLGTSTPTPDPNPYVRPTPKPTRTIEELVADATTLVQASPTFLASEHLSRGAQCQSCHTPFPPTGSPAAETCLSCHGSSQEKLTALRYSKETKWHEMHLDIIGCADCHYGHEKFEVKC